MNILERIKSLVFSLETGFADYELTDGTKIKTSTEDLEIGSRVMVVSESGEESAAPAGTHTLSDGRSIITDEAGTVTEIREKDAPVAEEETMSEEAAAEIIEQAPEIIDEAKEIVDEMTPEEVDEGLSNAISEEIVALIIEKVAESEAQMMKKMKEMMSVMEDVATEQQKFATDFAEFKASPSAAPLSQTEFNFSEEKLDLNAERIKRIKALRDAKN